MPIKGLSDKRRFSRGGKIRLGQKATNAKGAEYPEKSDHFIFDPEDTSLIPKWHALFGEKPTRIKACFASESTEDVFPQYYKCYGSTGLICKGDGERANRARKDGPGMDEVECPGPDNCEFALERGVHGKPGCKQVASLQFFIPDLPVMQVFQIDTTSYNSIMNINSALDVLRNVAGRISMIPITLMLKSQDATNPATGKKVLIYVLDMIIAAGLSDIGALQPLTPRAALEAPKPSDALPDDLYPRSQIEGPLEDPTPEPEAVKTKGLQDNPLVVKALRAAGASVKDAKRVFAMAATNYWDADTTLRYIEKHPDDFAGFWQKQQEHQEYVDQVEEPVEENGDIEF